jgi:hypothetical protein
VPTQKIRGVTVNSTNQLRRLEDAKALFQQPTAEEVSRLVFAELRDSRVHAQETTNHFAHLLNRGSSLE